MNIVDLLVTIVVVTILVTIVLAVVTYVAYKLRLSREPDQSEESDAPQFFVPYPPPTERPEGDSGSSSGATPDSRPLEEHASEA